MSNNNRTLARMVIDFGYVVDINDPDMIERAKHAFYEDMMHSVKYDEIGDMIDLQEADPSLTESEIPAFLLEEEEIEEEVY